MQNCYTVISNQFMVKLNFIGTEPVTVKYIDVFDMEIRHFS